MEDREYLQPILASYGMFRPLRTHYAFILHLIATVALDIAAIVLTVLRPDERFNCREYFFLIYGHVGLWILTLVSSFVCLMEYKFLCYIFERCCQICICSRSSALFCESVYPWMFMFVNNYHITGFIGLCCLMRFNVFIVFPGLLVRSKS